MQKLRVESFSISLDGYGAGIEQSLTNPLGIRGEELHQWAFLTETFQTKVLGGHRGEIGLDNDIARRGFENIGAWIMGRHMFGPIRGAWPDDNWRGWWGDDPPYHTDVFVLTHYPRDPIVMEGGTVFHFIDETPQQALQRAFVAANGRDVRLGGGVATVREFLRARLIDEMHIAVAPIFLGKGEHLFANLDMFALGYECIQQVASDKATHLLIVKK